MNRSILLIFRRTSTGQTKIHESLSCPSLTDAEQQVQSGDCRRVVDCKASVCVRERERGGEGKCVFISILKEQEVRGFSSMSISLVMSIDAYTR